MNYGMEMVQINDGLTETAACGSSAVYDKANGLVFVSYMTGIPKHYGEATGKICLAIFSPSQPENVRRIVVDCGVGQSRGILGEAIYLIGDGKVRMIFSTALGELATYARDYDFYSNTLSDRMEILFRTEEGDIRLNSTSYEEYVEKHGHPIKYKGKHPTINKVTTYRGELYTAVSADGLGYATLCKIEDNVIVPFAMFPERITYEFRYIINDNGIFGMCRFPPDDHEAGHIGYTVSIDGGKSWETTIFEDGVQSRPDILDYYGKPLIVYNYKSDWSTENFPKMHNSRNAIKMVYDGKVIFDWFTKYGVVEHETINIRGDLYLVFSNCPQALSTENGSAWIENGVSVEQGKEAIQWAKIGCLIDNTNEYRPL